MEGLADEPDRLKGSHPQVNIRSVTHETEQDSNNIHPLSVRQLYGRDSGDDLRGYGTDLAVGGGKGHERILLDLVLRAVVEGEPAVGVVGLPGEFLGEGGGDVARAWRRRGGYVLVLIGCS